MGGRFFVFFVGTLSTGTSRVRYGVPGTIAAQPLSRSEPSTHESVRALTCRAFHRSNSAEVTAFLTLSVEANQIIYSCRSTSVEVTAFCTRHGQWLLIHEADRSTSVEVRADRTGCCRMTTDARSSAQPLSRSMPSTHDRRSAHAAGLPPLNLCRGQCLPHRDHDRAQAQPDVPLNLFRGHSLSHNVQHYLPKGLVFPLNLCRGRSLPNATRMKRIRYRHLRTTSVEVRAFRTRGPHPAQLRPGPPLNLCRGQSLPHTSRRSTFSYRNTGSAQPLSRSEPSARRALLASHHLSRGPLNLCRGQSLTHNSPTLAPR